MRQMLVISERNQPNFSSHFYTFLDKNSQKWSKYIQKLKQGSKGHKFQSQVQVGRLIKRLTSTSFNFLWYHWHSVKGILSKFKMIKKN